MKIKRLLLVITLVLAAFLVVSTLNMTSASAIVGKKTPAGLLKTPGAMATQNAINHEAGIFGNPHGKPANFQGTISAIDATSISILLKDGSSVTIAITADTKIRIPKGKSTEIPALVPGLKVMVHATRNADDSLTARSINLIPRSANAPEISEIEPSED